MSLLIGVALVVTARLGNSFSRAASALYGVGKSWLDSKNNFIFQEVLECSVLSWLRGFCFVVLKLLSVSWRGDEAVGLF